MDMIPTYEHLTCKNTIFVNFKRSARALKNRQLVGRFYGVARVHGGQ